MAPGAEKMILTGTAIYDAWRRGDITLDPFDESHLNPNSYNFRLGDRIRSYADGVLDPMVPNEYVDSTIPREGLVLQPCRLYLVNTLEVLGSTRYVPTFAARSSVARLGLFINLSASLGDIGFVGQWTLQLVAMQRLRVLAGMRIGQMMFWEPRGKILLYNGKYQGSTGPQSTLIYRDFVAEPVVT
jgi:deoxycytidine triphosphate deaminase